MELAQISLRVVKGAFQTSRWLWPRIRVASLWAGDARENCVTFQFYTSEKPSDALFKLAACTCQGIILILNSNLDACIRQLSRKRQVQSCLILCGVVDIENHSSLLFNASRRMRVNRNSIAQAVQGQSLGANLGWAARVRETCGINPSLLIGRRNRGAVALWRVIGIGPPQPKSLSLQKLPRIPQPNSGASAVPKLCQNSMFSRHGG